MEQVFVKCEPESVDDLNDHLFSEEDTVIKVRGINVQLTCYANHKCYKYVVFSFFVTSFVIFMPPEYIVLLVAN